MKTIMHELTSIEEYHKFCESDKTIVFTFSADWCPDCMFIKPFMPKMIEKFSDYQFVYVNTQKFPLIAKDLNVMGIPSFVAMKNGEEKGRFVSKLRKTEAEIDAFLNSL